MFVIMCRLAAEDRQTHKQTVARTHARNFYVDLYVPFTLYLYVCNVTMSVKYLLHIYVAFVQIYKAKVIQSYVNTYARTYTPYVITTSMQHTYICTYMCLYLHNKQWLVDVLCAFCERSCNLENSVSMISEGS